MSATYHAQIEGQDSGCRDLYFPKPFNDEQVRIVQLLDVSDGVVVQGPPGTGKTHTIANVICHYLADGKRVLVTSMKDPALAVLQQQLPEEIRPLAIALLSSEQDGMKQFEHAIHKIASEVQGFDRAATSKTIAHRQDTIDALHGKLALIDRKINEWAKKNLTKISLEAEEIDPQDAAREVVESSEEFSWLPDALGIAPQFTPQFSDADIAQLRDARRELGKDLEYFNASLPQIVEFADSKTLLQVHQDLSQFENLQRAIERGDVPALADSTDVTLSRVHELVSQIEKLYALRNEIQQAGRRWTTVIKERLRRGQNDDVLRLLEALGGDLNRASGARRIFLEKPVSAPHGVELDADMEKAIRNLSDGKSAFGLLGFLSGREQRQRLEAIRVLGNPPKDSANWKHVASYLGLLRRFRELAVRWNALARELRIDTVSTDKPDGGIEAASNYEVFVKIKQMVTLEANVSGLAVQVFPNWPHTRTLLESEERLTELEQALRHHLTRSRLATVWTTKERCQSALENRSGPIIDDLRHFFGAALGNATVSDADMQSRWSVLIVELSRVLTLRANLDTVRRVSDAIEASGAPKYAAMVRMPLIGAVDPLVPSNWRRAWRLRRLATHSESIDTQGQLKTIAKDRGGVERDLAVAYRDIVVNRTWLKLAENASPSIRAALQAYLNAVQKIGKGKGKRAVRYRQDARMAASLANPAVPCWIMAHYRVSESLPPELGCFDLVIIDEASQSDLTALPALLRAQKVLIVGDDKQVSPEGVGLEEEKVRNLMARFLSNQVETYRPQMSPERSIYDLYKVVFAKSAVMLKEHFRCVPPIIEYSKREFYNHELRPLRLPRSSERLDPPLVDVLVQNGYRRGDVNLPEARFIVEEIKKITSDSSMNNRSIGVVSLLGDKQALLVWERLTEEVGTDVIQRHRITCGDARTFQGKERDIMFLSMVAAPNDLGAPLVRDTFAQRFNVAASRARDRMYLVRSVEIDDLSEADRLRRSLIQHFVLPFVQDEIRVETLRALCESAFERELYDELTQRGYWVVPQVHVGTYRIDMVVEGHDDARLAVECDGDKYHSAEKWSDDMQRQRILERAGWVFWRCFASTFIRKRQAILEDLVKTLDGYRITPIGAEGAPRSVHSEQRVIDVMLE